VILLRNGRLLAAKEIKFLRGQMGLTQADLGRRLRVADQNSCPLGKRRNTNNRASGYCDSISFI